MIVYEFMEWVNCNEVFVLVVDILIGIDLVNGKIVIIDGVLLFVKLWYVVLIGVLKCGLLDVVIFEDDEDGIGGGGVV